MKALLNSANATLARSCDAISTPAENVDASATGRGVEWKGAHGPAASRDAIGAGNAPARQSEPGPADFLDASTTPVKPEE